MTRLADETATRKRRKNLTPEEKVEIAALREKGWGLESLADRFKCTRGSIAWCCLMQGAFSPGADKRKPPKRTQPYIRGGRAVRPFSTEEDELIERMRAEGATLTEIAAATGRRHNSITGRLASLARKRELVA